jgi:hypothetical protein
LIFAAVAAMAAASASAPAQARGLGLGVGIGVATAAAVAAGVAADSYYGPGYGYGGYYAPARRRLLIVNVMARSNTPGHSARVRARRASDHCESVPVD